MSTSVPPRDGGALSGTSSTTGTSNSLPITSFLADEAALRRVFDSEYDPLLASARTQLGDAASQAPRVVQTAFINAWTQRAELQNVDQVSAFLTADVQHGASRALSRRAAAHRFGTHGGRDGSSTATHAAGGAASADDAWTYITATLHHAGSSTDAHASIAEAGRHEAAAHMKSVGQRQSWVIPLVLGLVALVVIIAGVMYTSRLGEDAAIASAVNSTAIQPIQSSPGQIGSVTLGDGTKMRMGPDTKIMIPDGFPTKLRALKVDGTAQFDVAPGQPQPFHVVAKRTHIIATGTSFAVSAYQGDSLVFVTVKEGTVTVKAGNQSSTVTANQTLVVDRTTMRPPTEAEAAEAFGWTEGHVAVTNKHLRDAVAQLKRWFNLDILVPKTELLDRDASFSVSLDSSRAAIAQVEKSANVKFAYEGENKVFQDALAKK